jgi:hypothetical protein
MDALARKAHETHDRSVKEKMAREYVKLKEPWRFVER